MVVLKAFVDILSPILTFLRFSQILEVTAQRFHYGRDVLKASARHGSSDTFSSVARILETKLELDQVCPF